MFNTTSVAGALFFAALLCSDTVHCLDEATIVDQGGQWDVSVTALSRAGALPGTPVAGAVDIEYCFPY